jgi:hypothetical protein
MNSITVFM